MIQITFNSLENILTQGSPFNTESNYGFGYANLLITEQRGSS
jgi:hypothetical protein